MEAWNEVKRKGHITASPEAASVLQSPKRVRVRFAGATVADSTRALLLREPGHLPVYYFPRDDVRMERLQRTGHATHCPHKGDAAYFTVALEGQRAENAAWSYEQPPAGVEALAGHLAFRWEAMEAWFEEDEQVYVHARDPFVRVDILDSSRRVRVVLGGETVAETSAARFVFETGHPTRHYIPPEDVRMELLRPSQSVTRCPYKGTARYWHAAVGGRTFADIVWSYPDPVPESRRIRDLLCFYDERADALEVAAGSAGEERW